MARIPVFKTYKNFIDGKFVRSESGRYFQLKNKADELIANLSLSSRKDFRNAVSAALKTQSKWSAWSGFQRSQVLYRMAEMLETRKEQFIDEMCKQGYSKTKAQNELLLTIDVIIYYTGWADKYQVIHSSVNPVNSSHFNFSVPEAMGVVAAIAPENAALIALVQMIVAGIAGGNTMVILASEKFPLCAMTLAEVIATSDIPAGVVNLLSGSRKELLVQFASHMAVNALFTCDLNEAELIEAEKLCALNVKRSIHFSEKDLIQRFNGPDVILALQEIKTTWHPIEKISAEGGKY